VCVCVCVCACVFHVVSVYRLAVQLSAAFAFYSCRCLLFVRNFSRVMCMYVCILICQTYIAVYCDTAHAYVVLFLVFVLNVFCLLPVFSTFMFLRVYAMPPCTVRLTG